MRADRREAARYAREEREAIQGLAREEEAERARAEAAARPRVFAPDPPDPPKERARLSQPSLFA